MKNPPQNPALPSSLKLLISGLLAAFLTPFVTGASTLILDDFQSYELVAGTFDINGERPNDGNTNNWVKAGGGSANLSTNVIAGSSTTGNPPNSQVLHLLQEASVFSWFGRRTDLINNTPSSSIINYSYKMRLPENDDSKYFHSAVGQWSPQTLGNMIVRLEIDASDGSLVYRAGSTGPGVSPTNTTLAGFNFDPDEWYQIDITMNLDTQQYGFGITNLADPQNIAGASDLFFAANFASFEGIGFTAATDSSARNLDLLLNDVQVTAIPEPNAIMLAILLLPFFICLRRKIFTSVK